MPFYMCLMLLSPLFNAVFQSSVSRRTILCTVVACLVVGWIPTVGHNVHLGMLRVAGFQGRGIALMIGTYCGGRLVREYNLAAKGSLFVWMCCFILCVVVMAMPHCNVLTSNGYASPFAIGAALCGFVAFLHLPSLPGRIGRAVNFISPSMFGVYILHECCVKKFQYFDWVVSWWSAFSLSVVLFAACVGIDSIRRMFVAILKKSLPLSR